MNISSILYGCSFTDLLLFFCARGQGVKSEKDDLDFQAIVSSRGSRRILMAM